MKIKTQDIKVTLGNNEILKGITINVQNKEFVGVIGPNGSGKTTFLKTIYRALKPLGGCIEFDGQNIDHLSLKETAKKMAVVGQHNFYDFDFSVLEIVLMGRSPHKGMMELDSKEDYEIALNALSRVNMVEFINRGFASLSGGEQQRVILARALTQNAQILVLDEPTNHLDIKYQLQLLDIVKSLNIEVISALHDLNLAAMYCDKIYVINEGKVFAYGKPAEVLTEALIKEVFDVEACVSTHPVNGKLNILYQSNIG